MRGESDREVKILLIFLEHPGGLRWGELWNIVDEQDICAKETLSKILKGWMEPPSSLIEINDLGIYTLGLTEPIAQILREGAYDVSNQIDRFLQALYDGFAQAKEQQAELFYNLATLYLQSKVTKMSLSTFVLFPFFFDKRIRELWLRGQKYAFDVVFDKSDEISERLFKIKISHEPPMDFALNVIIAPRLEQCDRQLALINKQLSDLVGKLPIKDDTKRKIESQLISEPLLKTFSKQHLALTKLIRALEKAKKKVS